MAKKNKKHSRQSETDEQLLNRKIDELADSDTPHTANVIDSLVGSLGEALEEDYSEIDEVLDDGDGAGEKTKTPIKRRVMAVLGAFIIIMSVIGVISTVNFTASFIGDIANQTALKSEFALFLFPVVTSDPPTFEDIASLPSSTIVTSAIWKIILTGDTEKYEKLYNFYMVIPEIDVENSARSLFGYGFEIEHQSISDLEMSFDYDPETASYTVPMNPTTVAYSPKIAEISHIGELYTVTVEYMAPSPMTIAGLDYKAEPIKTLIYTISRSGSNMTISAIRNTEQDESEPYIY